MKLKPREKKLIALMLLLAGICTIIVMVIVYLDITLFADPLELKTSRQHPKSAASTNAANANLNPSVSAAPSNKPKGGKSLNTQTVYVVPLGNFTKKSIQQILEEYRDKLDGNFVVLDPLLKDFQEPSRNQDNSNSILDTLAKEYPQYKGSCLIAITNHDAYSPDRPDWRFVLSDRRIVNDTKVGMIAIARMRPSLSSDAVASQRVKSRTVKMLKKSIGMLRDNLPVSNNKSSVMYGPVLSSDELDEVGWDY